MVTWFAPESYAVGSTPAVMYKKWVCEYGFQRALALHSMGPSSKNHDDDRHLEK
eukprot:c45261_g1_i1 orf=60-221(+)